MQAGGPKHRLAYLCGMKSFDVPIIYRSPLISAVKRKRKEQDKMKYLQREARVHQLQQ